MVQCVSGPDGSFELSEELVAGVAGAGVFGGHHARKFAALDGVRMAAVYDTDAARAGVLAAACGARPYTDYAAFLAAVDILAIAAPASEHYMLARAALGAGRHVLIEKPLATSLDHADRLIDLAGRKKLVLQVGHQERFVADAFGVLRRPEPPRSVWCRRHNPPSGRGEDVSVVLDLMIHDLDLLRQLGLGAPVSINAEGDADHVEAELAFEGGAMAVLSASRTAPRADRRMTLVYDDGVVELDFVSRKSGNTTPTPLAATFEDAAGAPALADPLGLATSLFVEAVRAGGPAPIPGSAGRAALEWALAIDAALAAEPAPALMRAGL